MKKKDVFESKAVKLRASTNGIKQITDHELASLIDTVDKHTTSEEDFQVQLIKALYSYFGWAYFTQDELKDDNNKIQLVMQNYKNSN
tara:strand:+ start:270 stop:530 length:261 start_codon:yes stop_codon:yes gene_type:complete